MKECPTCYLCFDDELYRCPHDDEELFTSNKCKTTLSRYILERRLGKGGMGSVYKAKHKFLKSLHAIKIISPEVVKEDAGLLIRFRQEAILAASIYHPNVVTVTDYGVENEHTPYLVMEYIEGIGLDDFMRSEQQLSPVKAFEILTPMALGVAEAHSRGIIHRDLKPLNIMLKNGYPLSQAVKVLDFGLAKIKSSESFASLVQAKTNNLLGSPHYMPPEQWANEGVDTRSDIYSMGVILFQMLTGDVPFKGDSILNIMYQHLQVPTPSLLSHGVSISPQIEAVIQKALAKEQSQRYSTVEEFLSEYEKALLMTSNRMAKSAAEKTVSFFDSSLYRVSRIPTQGGRKNTDENFGNTYNLAYLTSAQNQTLANYFNQPKPSERGTEKLEEQFIHAQNRVEEARTRASEAEKLTLEFNQAQKAAEDARQKVLEAKQKLEQDVQRIQAEMESKLAVEREAREKAEAEAHRLMEETKARKEAEERANQLAKTALEAQQRAEEEHEKAEKEIQHRQLEEGSRREAEKVAEKLAAEVVEAKKKYEVAKKEAEYEAHFRMEAEIKHKKIEEDVQRIAQIEAEKRKIAEAQAAEQIKEQASRLENQASEAQKKADEARLLAQSEAEKRELAEAARIKAEAEACRLAEEIIESQKRLEEAQQLAKSESEKRAIEKAARIKAEESARSLSAIRDEAESFYKNRQAQISGSGAGKSSPPFLTEEIVTISSKLPSRQMLLNTSSSNISNTNQIPLRRNFNPLFLAASIFSLFLVSGFGGVLLFSFYNPPTAENHLANSNVTNTPVQTPPQLPARLNEKMVLIKGGTFQMGSDDVKPNDDDFGNQYPAHPVDVPDFYIDRTEVTNEEYAEFIRAESRAERWKTPENWQKGSPPAGEEKFPVTDISHSDATAFADWITRRDKISCQLPAEKEWEYAARSGNQQNTYPWGNVWVDGRANIKSGARNEVGTTGDATSVGDIQDMMGNVMEWTSTFFYYYPEFPKKYMNTDFNPNETFTARGVPFNSNSDQIKNKHLLLTNRRGFKRDKKYPYLGFRLACHR